MTSSYKNLSRLESTLAKTQGINDVVKKAETYRDEVVAVIQLLRKDIDSLESIVPRDMWPVPTYTDLLFKL
jgi:glutamine synthetase